MSCSDATDLPIGSPRSHCAVCHQTFGTVDLFDWHRNNGRCRSVKDFIKEGLVNERGYWQTAEAAAATESRVSRLSAARRAV